MILVINTNSNLCRIYDYEHHSKLVLVKEIEHPEIKHKASEGLTSDRPGHFHGDGSMRGAYSPHTDPKDAAIESFSREIAKELDKRRETNNYDKIIIIAPPHVNGILCQTFNKNVTNLITNNIKKDIIHFTDKELLEFLHSNATYVD